MPAPRWWWWAATVPISSLFGLEVLLFVGEAVPSDWPTLVHISFPTLAGLTSWIGLQRSFRWIRDWFLANRTRLWEKLVPDPPRSVLIRVGGVACIILGGLVIIVAGWVLYRLREGAPPFLVGLLFSEGTTYAAGFIALGLIAVGTRLFKGTWPGKDYWQHR